MSDAESTQDLTGQPVDEPVVAAGQTDTVDLDEVTTENGTWGGKVADPDDGVPDFDEEDSEEVQATLGDDTYDEAEAVDDGEGPQ